MRFLACVFLPLWMMCPTLPAMAAPGEFDRSFGQNGIANLSAALGSSAYFVTTDSTGRILATGEGGGAEFVARLRTDGVLDTSFNGTGYVRGVFETNYESGIPIVSQRGIWVASAADGRVLAMRTESRFCPAPVTCSTYRPEVRTRRFNTDGTLDGGFADTSLTRGNVGEVQVEQEPAGGLLLSSTKQKLFLGGETTLARMNANGLRDESFDANVQALITCRGLPEQGGRTSSGKVLALANGKSLLAQGVTVNPNPGYYNITATANPHRVCISRLNADGTLDPTYGNGGELILDSLLFTSAQHRPVALLATGNGGAALVLQQTRIQPSSSHYVIVWLTASGALDTSRFDQGITGPTALHVAIVEAAVMQRDGKIVLAGYPELPGRAENFFAQQIDYSDPRVGRLHPQGGNDLTFGSGGLGYTPMASFGLKISPYQLHIAEDGSIFIAGSTADNTPTGAPLARFAIAKLQGGPSPVQPVAQQDGGGGGCGSTRDLRIDPMLPGLAILALVALAARRRRN